MKKIMIGTVIIAVLAVAAFAFAHMRDGEVPGRHMMGDSYCGSQHMGPGSDGGHMMGSGCRSYGGDPKFLNETRELRKSLHDKRFEYFEAYRNPDTNQETLSKLGKEIDELRDKIAEKMPRTAYGETCGPCCK